MPDYTLEISGASIVLLLGSFNPAIFHPEWFSRNGLLPRGKSITRSCKLYTPK